MTFAATFLITTLVFNKQLFEVKDRYTKISTATTVKASEAVLLNVCAMAVHDLFERGHETLRLRNVGLLALSLLQCVPLVTHHCRLNEYQAPEASS